MELQRIKTLFSLLRYLKGLRFYMFINTLICILYELLPIINMFLISFTVGAVISRQVLNYGFIFFILIICSIIHAIFGYANMWTEHDIAYRIIYRLRACIYNRLEQALPSFKSSMTTAEMTSIASNDLNLMEWFYAHTVNIFIAALVLVLVLLIFTAYIHFLFVINTFIWITLYLLGPLIFEKRSQLDGKRVRESFGALSSAVMDIIQGMKEILSFNCRDVFQKHFFDKVTKYDYDKKADAGRRSFETMYYFLVGSLMLICALIISFVLYSYNVLASVWIPVISSLSGIIFVSLGKFTNMASQFSSLFAAAERVFTLLNLPIQVEDTGTEIFNEEIKSITFENVTFSYPMSSEIQIKNMSFTIDRGETVAICGESGAGKSTIAHLLQRYIDPDKGRILINGKDIKTYTLESWRSILASVSQNTYLFNTTIAENIKMGNPNASLEEIRSAAEIAQAAGFIEGFEKGYDTEIGERALKISGGQRQRLSIARAVLKGSPVIIFDEAQSSLDSENEFELVKSLKPFLKNRILLSIAHRISSIKSADKVLFIDKGIISAFDTFENLSNENELFKQKVLGL